MSEYTAQEIAELYFERGGKIFSRSLLHQLSSVWGVLDEKYPATEVEKVFDDYLGSARLKDALTNVLVTAFEIQKRTPGSSAAPTPSSATSTTSR